MTGSRKIVLAVMAALLVAALVAGLARHPEDASTASPTARPAIEAGERVAPMDSGETVPATPVPAAQTGHAFAPWRARSTEPDLHRTYLQLGKSGDGGDLYVARAILTDCFRISRFDSREREVAAGLPMRGTRELPAAVQIAAAVELLARCHGFEGMSRLDVQQARADINTRLHRAGDPVAMGDGLSTGRLRVGDELLRSILASQDPVAIGAIGDQLARRRRKTAGLPVDGDQDATGPIWLENMVVGTLVACDLGNPCGSDSFEMREKCVFHANNCTPDLRTWILTDSDPSDRSRIEAAVASIVAAIRTGDYSLFGL